MTDWAEPSGCTTDVDPRHRQVSPVSHDPCSLFAGRGDRAVDHGALIDCSLLPWRDLRGRF